MFLQKKNFKFIKNVILPGNVSIVCNMVVTKFFFFFSISKQNNPKIIRKYRAAWNFLQIYFETLSDYASRIIIISIMNSLHRRPSWSSVYFTKTLCFPRFPSNYRVKDKQT